MTGALEHYFSRHKNEHHIHVVVYSDGVSCQRSNLLVLDSKSDVPGLEEVVRIQDVDSRLLQQSLCQTCSPEELAYQMFHK